MKADLLKFVNDQITRYTAEREQLTAILDELPDLDYKAVSTSAYRADFRASFEVETTDDVRPLLETLVPHDDLILYQDSCSSFFLAERRTEKERQGTRATVTPVGPVTVRCSHLGHPGSITFECYHRLPSGKLLSVHVVVKQSWQWVSWAGHKRLSHGAVRIEGEVFSHHFTDSHHIRWHTGSPEYFHNITLYWDHDTPLDTLFLRDSVRHEVR